MSTQKPGDTIAVPVKPFSIKDAPIIPKFDMREGAEYRAKAKEMTPGSAISNMPKDHAGKLYRAIEEVHGDRTASQKMKDGLYTVVLLEKPREKRTRTTTNTEGKSTETKASV